MIADFDKQLRDITKEKDSLNQKGIEVDNALNKLNSSRDRRQATVDYQNIIADAKAIDQRAKHKAKEAERIEAEIDRQSKNLSKFLEEYEKQQSLVEDLHQLLKETKQTNDLVVGNVQEQNALCSILIDIVNEMEGAVEQDYKLKEALIVK